MSKTLNQHLGGQAFESIYGGALPEGAVSNIMTPIPSYIVLTFYILLLHMYINIYGGALPEGAVSSSGTQ